MGSGFDVDTPAGPFGKATWKGSPGTGAPPLSLPVALEQVVGQTKVDVGSLAGVAADTWSITPRDPIVEGLGQLWFVTELSAASWVVDADELATSIGQGGASPNALSLNATSKFYLHFPALSRHRLVDLDLECLGEDGDRFEINGRNGDRSLPTVTAPCRHGEGQRVPTFLPSGGAFVVSITHPGGPWRFYDAVLHAL